MEMEIEPYLVASTLVAAAAQRLVRRLCPLCRKSTQVMPGEENVILPQGTTIYEPGGCRECQGKGFKGRLPVLELLQTDANFVSNTRPLTRSQKPPQKLACEL
jgi:type II secretory ATPase GspE/PulE/Tfp pilus assembly ATPase PilB-like protein